MSIYNIIYKIYNIHIKGNHSYNYSYTNGFVLTKILPNKEKKGIMVTNHMNNNH